MRRVYRLLEGDALLSYRGERHESQARGANGGEAGASQLARMLRVDGTVEHLGSRARVEWRAGDVFVLETAGAGGWGAMSKEALPERDA